MTERTGSCLCGEVRYRLTADPVGARVCWCRDCQRIAANGTVNAVFPAGALSVTGPITDFVRTAHSGNAVRRRFCSRCGCHLFAESPGYPGFVVVRVGTLDDPSSVRPVANIWASSAPPWACMDGGLQRFEQQPPPPRALGAS